MVITEWSIVQSTFRKNVVDNTPGEMHNETKKTMRDMKMHHETKKTMRDMRAKMIEYVAGMLVRESSVYPVKHRARWQQLIISGNTIKIS